MSGSGRGVVRALLALGVAAFTLLCAEGVASLLLGRSLLRPDTRAVDAAPLPTATDLDRRMAALRNPGVYRVHPDPFVNYVLRSNEQLEVAGASVTTDALGLRVRPGPAAPANALRLVVLGDSVAFGYGLNDGQTLACQLEQALGTLRGEAARPVAARTVAIPGWNHRNAIDFLFDHESELAPDIVVYLPIGNDLCDSDGVWETGQRRAVPDLSNPDPLLHVHTSSALPFMRPMLAELERLGKPKFMARLGPNVVMADLSAESRRRYDDDAASILRLQEHTSDRGGHLLVLRYEEANFYWHLERRLIASGAAVPVLPLFDRITDTLTLPTDPHPNATAVRAMAQWVAADLIARGWIDAGAGRPLPDVPAEVAELRGRERGPAEIVAFSDEFHGSARAALHPAVDWRDATGINQVYGTIRGDGSAGARLLVVLAPAGDTLVLQLQAIPSQPDLYPLDVRLEVDGQLLDTLAVPAGDSVTWRLKLPARERPEEPFEVKLVPARWAVQDVDGSATVVSFRPLRIACEP